MAVMTFEQWMEANHPEDLLEEDWRKWARNAAVGGALVGAGMGLGRFMGGGGSEQAPQPKTPAAVVQQQQSDDGVRTGGLSAKQANRALGSQSWTSPEAGKFLGGQDTEPEPDSGDGDVVDGSTLGIYQALEASHGKRVDMGGDVFAQDGKIYVVKYEKARGSSIRDRTTGKRLAIRARAELAQRLGTGTLRGVTSRTLNKKGHIGVVVSWSPEQAEMAKQAAQQMGN